MEAFGIPNEKLCKRFQIRPTWNAIYKCIYLLCWVVLSLILCNPDCQCHINISPFMSNFWKRKQTN